MSSNSNFKFSCTRNILILFNFFYIILAIILISVSAYAKSISFASNNIIGGILACGVFLLILSIIGLVATLKHHQVLLFFYMIILFLLFIIQFIIGCVCLTFSYHVESDLIQYVWKSLNNNTIEKLDCCGFKNITENTVNSKKSCIRTCYSFLEDSIEKALRLTGAIGLTFSLFQIVGVWIAAKYRNLRNPKWNPNEFL